MQSINDLAAQIASKFHKLQGVCETHGEQTISLPVSETAWRCPKCYEAEIAQKERHAWTEKRRETLNAISRIPDRYKGERFVAHNELQRLARGVARDFRDFILERNHWAVLILTGVAGTGKTLMACEIAEAFINRLMRSVRYTTAAGMVNEIRASYKAEDKTEDSEIERFAQYDILIIDEIDATRGTANDNMLLTEVINRRYSYERPVVIITNQPRERLIEFVGDRVDDRLHENSFVASFDWPSFRRNPVNSHASSPSIKR